MLPKDQRLAAVAITPEISSVEETPEEIREKKIRLFRSRKNSVSLRMKTGHPLAIGNYGVTSLEDVKDLMERYESTTDLLKAVGLSSRQAMHEAIKGITERLSRPVIPLAGGGTYCLSKSTMALLSALLVASDANSDKLTEVLCRFLIRSAAAQDKTAVAEMLAFLFGIPLDMIVNVK